MFAGLGAWWDAVNVSEVPAAITDLMLGASIVLIVGLLGALNSIKGGPVAGLLMAIAGILSVIMAAVDLVFVPETDGVRPVGTLLLMAASLWLLAAWLILRSPAQSPPNRPSTGSI